MSANYDASKVGVPYVRVTGLNIVYPDGAGGQPSAQVFQAEAVVLADGTSRTLRQLDTLNITLDFASHGNDPVPIVDPTSGAALGVNTTMNQTFASVLAIIRQVQIASGQ
ncbi:MAG: hypothetical protein KGL39_36650 [Patescibacteria group bacterium]|nr:hypothetical protein [Patescibacteria group bacterium]